MKINNCSHCGKPAAIRTRQRGNTCAVWVECTHCGRHTKAFTGKQAAGANRTFAVLAWNCEYYEEMEGKA